jgi:hypothetical protein
MHLECCVLLKGISNSSHAFVKDVLSYVDRWIDSVVRIATTLRAERSGDRILVAGGGGAQSSVHTCPETHPASCIMGSGPSQEKNDHSAVLTTHLIITPGFEWTGAVSPIPLYARIDMSRSDHLYWHTVIPENLIRIAIRIPTSQISAFPLSLSPLALHNP